MNLIKELKQIKPPTALVILDGFGYRKQTSYNAILEAHTPHFDYLIKNYPHTLLQAAGTAVGLKPLSLGNSEVGHLTIGTGRIIKQPSVQLDDAIAHKTLATNSILLENFDRIKKNNGKLHCMGLLSDGGVHSSIDHLFAFLDAAKSHGIQSVVVHAFLDGRDVAPQSAALYLQKITTKMEQLQLGTLGSLHGRFYAMDRDNNWLRTQECYNALTSQQEMSFSSWSHALSFYYQRNITDEFIPPTQLNSAPIIQDNDGILFFNFRPDRARQLTSAFLAPHFSEFPTKKLMLSCFITPVYFNNNYTTQALLPEIDLSNTLKECLARVGKTIFSIAETEKYAHITYFFNGYKEAPVRHEKRVLIPSLPLKNYVQHPEMSAPHITATVMNSLKNDPHDFYLINYANADMVGHSGNFQATIKAIECLDKQLGILYHEIVEKQNGTLYITGDHGNAEDMFDIQSNQPKTAHTNNPVYFLMIKKELKGKQLSFSLQGLADIAPLILQEMNIPIPEEMKR